MRVVGQGNNKEMVFKLLPHTKMVRLKNIFADFVGLSAKQIKFFFKSTEVEDGDSADKLGMKDGDKIRAVTEAGAQSATDAEYLLVWRAQPCHSKGLRVRMRTAPTNCHKPGLEWNKT